MSKTNIEWATHTQNHQAGCNRVSPACGRCYAAILSVRLANMGMELYEGVTNGDLSNPKWTGKIRQALPKMKKNFREIRRATKPRRTFLGSMTDLFHESVNMNSSFMAEFAKEIESLRNGCRTNQILMLLTKRPRTLLHFQQHYFPQGFPEQIWVGVTAENQKWADDRIPILCQVKASVRFLSCEPMFGEIKLEKIWKENLEWIIAGGESGHQARNHSPQWFRSLRDQAVAAEIPFHFKQWGEWDPTGTKVGKKVAGRELDGRTWDEFPERVQRYHSLPSWIVGKVPMPDFNFHLDWIRDHLTQNPSEMRWTTGPKVSPLPNTEAAPQGQERATYEQRGPAVPLTTKWW